MNDPLEVSVDRILKFFSSTKAAPEKFKKHEITGFNTICRIIVHP